MKQTRIAALLTGLVLLSVLAAGCSRAATARGWAAPVSTNTQLLVSTGKGHLDGLSGVTPAPTDWTGSLGTNLAQATTQLSSKDFSGSAAPFRGDVMLIDSEMIHVKSVDEKKDGERVLSLERAYSGTTAADHSTGAKIAAFRRPWRFPDDWSISEKAARSLQGIYGSPVTSTDGAAVFLGDYNGYVYAFRPGSVNLDASNDKDQPRAVSLKLNGPVIGGLTLDPTSGYLYVTSGTGVFKLQSSQLAAKIDDQGQKVDVSEVFNTGDEIWGAPLLASGKLYVSSLDGNLYAIDPSTGQEAWRYGAGKSLASTPVLAGNLVLVGGFDSKLHAVDATSGNEQWSFTADNWVWSKPLADSGRAYFGDFDGKLYAVDLSNGSLAWSAGLDKGPFRGSPAIAQGMLVVATESGWLVGINLSTQEKVWEKKLDTSITADLVAKDDNVLIAPSGCVSTDGGNVYYISVDPRTGDLHSTLGTVC